MNEFKCAWHMLLRDARAGELRLLAAAVVIAVASVTTVGFFTDRVQRALDSQANHLLGADLALVSDHPLDEDLAREASHRHLAVARTVRFPTMVLADQHNTLSELKAVSPGYPLRGALRNAPAPFVADAETRAIPQPGEAWVDAKLLGALG